MSKMFENKINIEIEPKKLGLIEKRLRLSSNLTIEQAAMCLNISKGSLSEMENGKRRMKEDVFLNFTKRFYPQFNFDLELVETASNKLDELALSFIYCNFSQENEIEKWVEDNRIQLLNSFACLYLTVFETYFYYRKSIDKEEEEQLNDSKNFASYFSPDVRAFLLFNKGYMDRRQGKNNQAVELFERALREMDGKKWPQLEGVIKQNLACAVSEYVSFQQSLDLVNQAQNCFIHDANYLRIVSTYNNKAVYLCLMGQYEKAISIVDKVILHKNTFQDHGFYSLAVSNKIMMEMLAGHFDRALQFIHDHKSEFNSRHPGNFILEPYSLLRLKDYKGCLKSIKSYKDCTLSEDDEAFYILIKAVIRNREDRIEKEKAKMFSICYRTTNWAMALLTLHLLIYHYKETKQNDHLVEIYEQQTMLYNHQMPDAWNV